MEAKYASEMYSGVPQGNAATSEMHTPRRASAVMGTTAERDPTPARAASGVRRACARGCGRGRGRGRAASLSTLVLPFVVCLQVLQCSVLSAC
jgi:hypothetical protein